MVFPHAFVIPLSREMIDHAVARPAGRHALLLVRALHQLRRADGQGDDARAAAANHLAAGLCAARRPDNDWGYDADEQRTATYTGMGMDINVHDQWAVESMGAIQDRTQGASRLLRPIITAARRMIFRAIDDGGRRRRPAARRATPTMCAAPPRSTAVGPVEGMDDIGGRWKRTRRRATPWLAPALATA